MDTKSNNIEERKKLYTYWKNLPFFKSVDSITDSNVRQSQVKSFIIKYIRDGIEDDFGKENNLSRRHAFTAKELHRAYESTSKTQKYSVFNFHFHIKSLVEVGYLKRMAKILEGRQYQTYYGRTAITFISRYDDVLSGEMNKILFDPMKLLIKEMNPDLENNEISELIEENFKLMEDFYLRVLSWMKANYPLLYKTKLDMLAFMNLAGSFSFFSGKYSENLKKTGTLLNLNHIMDYKRYKTE